MPPSGTAAPPPPPALRSSEAGLLAEFLPPPPALRLLQSHLSTIDFPFRATSRETILGRFVKEASVQGRREEEEHL